MCSICKECRGGSFSKIIKDGYKVCSKCDRELPATEEYFRKCAGSRYLYGLASICKTCESVRAKVYRKNNKDAISQKYKQYRANNLEKLREYSAAYQRSHREHLRDYCKTRFSSEKGKDIKKIYDQRRRAAKKAVQNNYSLAEWLKCKEDFGFICAYCGKASNALTQDHFIPMSKGGAHIIGNIIPACHSCNSSKNDSDFFEWYPKQTFYDVRREEEILRYLRINSSARRW